MIRSDLLHLSAEALAQIANRGIVKRAQRELDNGYQPESTVDEQGTLIARFTDGIVTQWPKGVPIQDVHCSCGARTVCRHRIIAALDYRESHSESGAGEPSATTQTTLASPGSASDTALVRLIPSTVLTTAKNMLAKGLSVQLCRTEAGEPCDTARLPMATVRFWAGDAIEAARCDCVRASACEHVALAVWAFRKADQLHPDTATAQIQLGQEGDGIEMDQTAFRALLEALLHHGVGRGIAPLTQALSQATKAAHAMKAVYLSYLLSDLEHWASAYVERSARYSAEAGVDLITELTLRLHAGILPGKGKQLFGVGQAQETELDRLRLVCLGARTHRDQSERHTTLILADTDTGTKFTLRKNWRTPDRPANDEAGHRRSVRLAPGVQMEQLGQGQLLAQNARRYADGSLTLAAARRSQNSVLPQQADWSFLQPPLRFSTVAQLAAHQRAYPSSHLLPRHSAGNFVVFTPDSISELVYDPSQQTLICWLCDGNKQTVLLRRSHQAHTPHDLDSMAGALSGQWGPLRHVAGMLHWEHGTAIIEPWALACDSVIVPDFATSCGALAQVPLDHEPDHPAEPVSQALQRCRSLISELLHHGASRLPSNWADDAADLCRQFNGIAFHHLARQLNQLSEALLLAKANPTSAQLATPLMHLLALRQLHQDAYVHQLLKENTAPACPAAGSTF